MKQIVMTGPKKSEVREVETVKPTADQILIRTKYVGVCMSEHFEWTVAKEGQVFGHEPMGIVAEVGKNVTGFAVGDRISGLWGGGMTEYVVADPKHDVIVKLPESVRDEDLVLEPLACLFSAVSKVRIPIIGATVCVVGAGYMGCGAISLLKMRGARVVAIDIHPASLEDAKRYGADEVYLVEEAKEKFCINPWDGVNGFDVVMEWAESDESLDLAINLTNMCGQLCVGAYHTGGKRLVDMQQLNVKAIECLSVHPREHHLNVQGVYNSAALLANGQWNYKDMPVKIFPRNKFDEAQAGFETKHGKYMKALVDMTMEDGEPYIVG